MATYVKGDKVANATSYKLFEGDTEIAEASEINFNVSELIKAEGEHTLHVKAYADGYSPSDASNTVKYTVSASGSTGDTEGDVDDTNADVGVVGTKYTVFDFDDLAENGVDISSLGTISNSTLTTSGSVNGVALSEDITLTKNESFTIEFISNFYGTSDGNGLILGGGTEDGGGSFLYLCWMSTLKCLRLRDSANAVQADGALTTLSSADEKAHFAVVYDSTSGTIKMYQNYEEVTVSFTKGTDMSTFADTVLNTICGGYTSQFIYKGAISYLKYTNIALASEDFHRE